MLSESKGPNAGELSNNQDSSELETKVLAYIPVHNGMKYIQECLDSVVSQPYHNQVIVVSDNGSDDGTPEFIHDKYPQVIVQEHKPYLEIANPGLRSAISSTTCKFFTQLGHDDKLSPNYWETVLPYFTTSDIGVVGVGCQQFSDNNPEGAYWPPRKMYSPLDILISNRFFIGTAVRREAWDEIDTGKYGGFDIKCFLSDWDMWIQIILYGWKWAYCDKPMFWYRRRMDSWANTYDPSPHAEQMSYMRNKWASELIRYNVVNTTMADPYQMAELRKGKK